MKTMTLMCGLLSHLYTRIYFADEEKANSKDPVLQSVPAVRRNTLIADPVPAQGTVIYRFDIHMQGKRETVFFDV